jgi:hypothetical protein
MLWNRNPVRVGQDIATPNQTVIENTFNLRQVSLEDAMRYGGTITREAIGAMNFHNDRNNIIVDTKVHFLMEGMCPAIPGWHTDGVPRGEDLNPAGTGAPNLIAQEWGHISAPRYHLLVTGTHCPTRFVAEPVELNAFRLMGDNPRNLYQNMTRMVDKRIATDGLDVFDSPCSTVLEWDWWNIHTAQQATGRGWRYLIRVTETDHIVPRTNPAEFIRTQNNVYAPMDFGW